MIVTGQQIGAGWTPALSVAKALAALAEAKRRGADAVYWMADEDHDRTEVAAAVGFEMAAWCAIAFDSMRQMAPPQAGCPGARHSNAKPKRCGMKFQYPQNEPCEATP